MCFSGEWSDWVVDKMVIQANCRELVDNISDVAHFATVHRAPIDYFANLFEDHKATQLMVGRSEKLGGDSLSALSTYFGTAVHITQMTGQSNGQPIHSVLLNCHVPIDMNSFELRYGVIVKKVAGLTDEQNLEIANAYVKEAQRAFYEDVDIWHSKTRIDNPLLCEGDGPLYQMRDWYSRFYLDMADVWRDVRRARDIRNADSRRRLAAGAAARVGAAAKKRRPGRKSGGHRNMLRRPTTPAT
ncbi:phenylpropionate dioxygenase-like ring-hydroxylating dioxygenase large terminal subunit [Burkholderia ambifaria]|nr:phenylpropionate dioxygenase-like ring-hydroxylating dioxygenase large terminal subunit [Burkholderia ambifaria]